MSVPPGNRSESSMQFIETADRIEARAMQVCRRWPKSWFFMITQRTVELASAVYEHAQNANAIFPITTEDERTERIRELHRAMGANYNFSKKIERAYSLFPICGEKKNASPAEMNDKSAALLQEFMELCLTEEEALKGNLHYTRSVELTGKASDVSTE